MSQRFPHEFPYWQHAIHCIIMTHSRRIKLDTKFTIKYLFGSQIDGKSNKWETLQTSSLSEKCLNVRCFYSEKNWMKKSVGRFRPTGSNLLLKPIYCDWKACSTLLTLKNPELNPICYLLALLGAYHFLHVSRIRVKALNLRLLISYIYGAPILDVSRSHTTTQHSR